MTQLELVKPVSIYPLIFTEEQINQPEQLWVSLTAQIREQMLSLGKLVEFSNDVTEEMNVELVSKIEAAVIKIAFILGNIILGQEALLTKLSPEVRDLYFQKLFASVTAEFSGPVITSSELFVRLRRVFGGIGEMGLLQETLQTAGLLHEMPAFVLPFLQLIIHASI